MVASVIAILFQNNPGLHKDDIKVLCFLNPWNKLTHSLGDLQYISYYKLIFSKAEIRKLYIELGKNNCFLAQFFLISPRGEIMDMVEVVHELYIQVHT